MHRPLILLAAILALAAGCGGDDDGRSQPARAPEPSEPASPAPPPDAGTQTGHGADRRERTEVPESDASPPKAAIVLESPATRAPARASEPGTGDDEVIRLNGPKLQGVAVGVDENGGVARVRVSVREEIQCAAGSEPRLRTRYFPPPQVERIRSNPGAVLPTRRVRSLPIDLSTTRCDGPPAEIRGELWGEAINGSGLEAVTPHLRFVFEP